LCALCDLLQPCPCPAGIKANQGESNQIKPNQTGWRQRLKAEGLMIKDESRKNPAMPQPDSQTQSGPVKPAGAAWGGGFYNRERRRRSCGCAAFALSRLFPWPCENQAGSSRIKPNQTKSNQIKPPAGRVGVVSGQWLVAKGGGGGLSGQTRSNPVKIGDSQESEQIMGCPLGGLLVPPEKSNRSNPVKPSQTQSNRYDLQSYSTGGEESPRKLPAADGE
jgi:hypothetical protein